MSKIIKIRDLVDRHPDDDVLVLNDIFKDLIALQRPLNKLEIHNYRESIIEAYKMIVIIEKKISAFKYRLKTEVRPEVLEFHKMKPKRKGHMHPNSLKNINSSK